MSGWQTSSAASMSNLVMASAKPRTAASPSTSMPAQYSASGVDRHVTGLGRHAAEPGVDRGVAGQVEAGLGRDVRVGIQGDVGDRVALADQELAAVEVALHSVERAVAAADLLGEQRL